jgi:hypothetical protein
MNRLQFITTLLSAPLVAVGFKKKEKPCKKLKAEITTCDFNGGTVTGIYLMDTKEFLKAKERANVIGYKFPV